MSYATKPVCFSCWNTYAPDKAIEALDPRRANVGPQETCFGCGAETHSGIYVRADLTRPFHLQRRGEA